MITERCFVIVATKAGCRVSGNEFLPTILTDKLMLLIHSIFHFVVMLFVPCMTFCGLMPPLCAVPCLFQCRLDDFRVFNSVLLAVMTQMVMLRDASEVVYIVVVFIPVYVVNLPPVWNSQPTLTLIYIHMKSLSFLPYLYGRKKISCPVIPCKLMPVIRRSFEVIKILYHNALLSEHIIARI